MKHRVLLLSSFLLLSSCGTSSGALPNERAISQEEGESKWSAITSQDNLASSLGNKCLEATVTMAFTDINIELGSDFSMAISADGSQEYRYDTVDDVSYSKSDFLMLISVTASGIRQSSDADTISETWGFEGKEATKTVVVSDGESQTTYSVIESSSSAKDKAISLISSTVPDVSGITWESIEYFGNDEENDLRVSANNGKDGEDGLIENFEMTFISGLPTSYSLTQTALLNGNETLVTASATFSYPENIDISTPDITGPEWTSSSSL